MTYPKNEQLFVEALATAMALNFSGSIGAALEYHPHAKIAMRFFEDARAEGVAAATAFLREQDGHGEWHEAADAIDAEFLTPTQETE